MSMLLRRFPRHSLRFFVAHYFLVAGCAGAQDPLGRAVETSSERYRVPAAAWVVAAARNAPIARTRGAGTDPRSVFNVGSVSKTITAWAILRLVDQGKIGLDEPVGEYLTRWRLPTASFSAKKVTIRRTLAHTAGLSVRSVWGRARGGKLATIVQALDGLPTGKGVRVIQEPGAGFMYSGGGYGILQLVVEEVSGESFAKHVRGAVLEPLGMSDSGFGWTDESAKRAPEPRDITGSTSPLENFSMAAAAGFRTTIRDLGRFIAAHLPGPAGELPGRGVLRPKTLALAMTADSETKGVYGLGYFLERLSSGATVIGHDGSNTGWNACFYVDVNRGVGMGILTASSHGRAVVEAGKTAWLGDLGEPIDADRAPPLTQELLVPLYESGVESAIERFRELEKAHPRLRVPEGYLNFLGYDLLDDGRVEEALELFQLVARLVPGSANAHDSLAEAWVRAKQPERAVKSYRRVLEIDPDHAGARAGLKKLGHRELHHRTGAVTRTCTRGRGATRGRTLGLARTVLQGTRCTWCT